MRASFQIASVRGIPIKLHVTFLIVLPFLAAIFAANLRAAAAAAEVPPERLVGPDWLWGAAIAIGLFAAVLLHELAHALYALKTGGRVRGITLFMFGGVSELSAVAPEPRREAMMAFLGPLTSFGIGAVLFGVAWLIRGTDSFNVQFAVMTLAALNMIVAVFNLLPAFPMDGGRILRALLSSRMGHFRATRLAALVGKGFALMLGVLGFFAFNFFLLIIAFFVFLGADAEWRQVRLKEVLGQLRVRDVMVPTRSAVPVNADLAFLTERMRSERQLALPVERGGEIVGVIASDALRTAARRKSGGATTIEAHMKPAVQIEPDASAWTAVERLAEHRVPQLVVLSDGQLAGTVSAEEIQRAVVLRATEDARITARPLSRDTP